MSHSMMVRVAGRNGEMVEVEQVDLFKHRINNMEFTLSVHTDPSAVGSQGKRSLAVSLYETGCRLTSLRIGDEVASLGTSIELEDIRYRVLSTLDDLVAEIGSSRLSTLLGNSLLEQAHFNS